MKALILAAGGGKDMSPFSTTRPKPMLHAAGQPLLSSTFRMLKESGFIDTLLVRGLNGNKICDYYGDGSGTGLNINYVSQKKTNGIGNAILLAKERFDPGEHFLLIYADVITDENILASVLQTFGLTHSPVAGIVLPEETSSFGNVYLDKNMNITNIVEKPARKDMGNYVLAGTYILPYTFFDILKKVKGNMTKALLKLTKTEGLKASIWEKGWMDIGRPWDILKANKIIMDRWQTASVHHSVTIKDAKIKGPVHIDEDVMIRSGVIIEGPAFIGRGSYIGNNSIIRKYSSIGQGSVVGFGVELKNCVLFGKGKIGRLSFVGDSVIGEGVEIGSGTMTINQNIDNSEIGVKINGKKIKSGSRKLGAFIGDNARLGSGHTIRPGSVIDSGIVVPHHYTYPPKRK